MESTTAQRIPARSDPGTGEPTDPDQQAAQQALDSALTTAQQAIVDGQAALAKGDFAAYGIAQQQLAAALEDAVAASRRLQGQTAATTPTPYA